MSAMTELGDLPRLPSLPDYPTDPRPRTQTSDMEWYLTRQQLSMLFSQVDSIVNRLDDLDTKYDELFKGISQVTGMSNQLAGEFTRLSYNYRLIMSGGVGMGIAMLNAVSTGVSRGIDAGQVALALQERLEKGEVLFGTSADRQRYIQSERWRFVARIFGVGW